MNLQPHFTAQKIEQLTALETQAEQLRQIFEWVKTGHISRAVFLTLIATVTMPTEDSVREWCDMNGFELTRETCAADLNFIARDAAS